MEGWESVKSKDKVRRMIEVNKTSSKGRLCSLRRTQMLRSREFSRGDAERLMRQAIGGGGGRTLAVR